MIETSSPSDLALSCAAEIRAAFADYNARFRSITQRAKGRFEQREWAAMSRDLGERIELYDVCVTEIAGRLSELLGPKVSDKALWAQIKGFFAALVAPLLDQELNKTFYNTLTRRFFKTRGVDAQIEFVALDIEPTDRITHPVARHSYSMGSNLWTLFRRVLDDFSFAVPYAEPERCARRIAEAVAARFHHWGRDPIVAIELLTTVFYRERRAYLVGRIFGEHSFGPLIIALKHDEKGIRADAVITEPEDVALVFGFTRSAFFADFETVGDAVVFLRTLLPRKPLDELYTTLGRMKQSKTERYRHFFRYLESSTESFVHADGERGMVMLVFTLPGYPLVFKVIRDKFAYPKNIVRQDVLDKYQLVFKHDRVGRLVDAQEFRYLKFKRVRFEAKLLDELLKSCRESVIEDGDDLVITHLYVERRLRPLNLYVREAPHELALKAVLDYGQAIKDLACSNIFAGDLLLKNFGVTRHARAIFYDYDELQFLHECRFRAMPRSGDGSDHPEGSWYYVGDNDVFPEQFIEFLGLPRPLREALLAQHGEIFDARWWNQLQQQLAQGQSPELMPYPEQVTLPA